jgi:hypothetical protein
VGDRSPEATRGVAAKMKINIEWQLNGNVR